MWDKISEAWCQTMHKRSSWPMHGRYYCLECGREFEVAWTESSRPQSHAAEPATPVYRLLDSRIKALLASYGEFFRVAFTTMKQYFRSAIT
jgi:hypothetical protein